MLCGAAARRSGRRGGLESFKACSNAFGGGAAPHAQLWPPTKSQLPTGEPSSSHSTSLLGLTNGTTYWVAVRPVDAGGLEGPVSAVVSAAPELTCGLVECTGDPGCTCSSAAPLRAPGVLALLALALGLGPLLRRRR